MKRFSIALCLLLCAALAMPATMRTLVNRAGVTRDAANTYRLYSEDWTELLAKIQAGTDGIDTLDLKIGGVAAVSSTRAGTLITLDTGQGANELYDMDQNVLTTSAVTFATGKLTTPIITAGSGTGITVNDTGSLRTQVYKVTIDNDAFIAASTTQTLTIGTLPAKSIVHAVIMDVTEAFVCASTCTTATLSASVGPTGTVAGFTLDSDIDAAIATFGDADAEVGTLLEISGNTNGGYTNWAGVAVLLTGTSGTGNWGDAAATFTNAGSVTVYILYSVLP